LHVPRALVIELEAVWALLPPPSGEGRDVVRKSIGDRGELYSYHLERLGAAVASDIVWVARDDDTLGFDIEDRSCTPRRRVEVKASGDASIRFYLSANEWERAHDDPENYEIHFWGGVNLGRDPSDDFAALRRSGSPVIFKNLPSCIQAGQLVAKPDRWKVTGALPVAVRAPD
jgi:hypothetical protein